MTIYYGLDTIDRKLNRSVVTIGNFDGVHKGHRALFEIVKGKARDIKGESVVLTFEPHPLKVLDPQRAPEVITPTAMRLRLIEEAGIQEVVCEAFTMELAKMRARDFVLEILIKRLGMVELVVGYDYAFGRNREGNIDLLKEMAREHGFGVYVLQPVNINGKLASSTMIRNMIKEGDVDGAKELLGRYYTITGQVVKGRGRGGPMLGVPTANVDAPGVVIPKRGVYATWAWVEGLRYQSVTNIGLNPTFGDGALSIECHIIGYSGISVGPELRVDFVKYLRDEAKFPSIESLKAQINKDIEAATGVLSSKQ